MVLAMWSNFRLPVISRAVHLILTEVGAGGLHRRHRGHCCNSLGDWSSRLHVTAWTSNPLSVSRKTTVYRRTHHTKLVHDDVVSRLRGEQMVPRTAL